MYVQNGSPCFGLLPAGCGLNLRLQVNLCLVFDFSGYQTNLVTADVNLYNMLH